MCIPDHAENHALRFSKSRITANRSRIIDNRSYTHLPKEWQKKRYHDSAPIFLGKPIEFRCLLVSGSIPSYDKYRFDQGSGLFVCMAGFQFLAIGVVDFTDKEDKGDIGKV